MKFSNILIVEDSKGRREIVLDKPVYSLGRDTNCNVHMPAANGICPDIDHPICRWFAGAGL